MPAKRALLAATALVCIAALGFSTATARGRSNKDSMPFGLDGQELRLPDARMLNLALGLHLSRRQIKKLNRLRRNVEKRTKEIQKDLKGFPGDLVTLLKKNDVTKAKLEDAVLRHRQALDDMTDVMLEALAEVHETLSPKQRDKVFSALSRNKKYRAWMKNEG